MSHELRTFESWPKNWWVIPASDKCFSEMLPKPIGYISESVLRTQYKACVLNLPSRLSKPLLSFLNLPSRLSKPLLSFLNKNLCYRSWTCHLDLSNLFYCSWTCHLVLSNLFYCSWTCHLVLASSYIVLELVIAS